MIQLQFEFARVTRFIAKPKNGNQPFGFAIILSGDQDSEATAEELYLNPHYARFTVVKDGSVRFGGPTRKNELLGIPMRHAYPEAGDIIVFVRASRQTGRTTSASAWCALSVYEDSIGRLNRLRARATRKGANHARQVRQPAPEQPPTIFHDHPEATTFDKWQIVSLANDDHGGLLTGFASGYPRHFTRTQLESYGAEALGFYADELANRRAQYGEETFVLQGGNGWDNWVNIRTVEPLKGEVPEPNWGNCNRCKCELTESENAIGFLCDDCRAKAHAKLDSMAG